MTAGGSRSFLSHLYSIILLSRTYNTFGKENHIFFQCRVVYVYVKSMKDPEDNQYSAFPLLSCKLSFCLFCFLFLFCHLSLILEVLVLSLDSINKFNFGR